MKVTMVQNGVLSLILTPESERESNDLKELAKGEISLVVHEKLQILDKILPNSAVITPIGNKVV